MHGTLKQGDSLKIKKTSLAELHLGDVITFTSIQRNNQTNELVHRIIKMLFIGPITRGDNNSKNDEEPVTEKNLIGKVTHYERNGKIHKVWNGRLGMLRARVLHGRLHLIRSMKFFLRKPYRLVKKTGIVAKLWRPEIQTIHFQTQDGPLVKYVHNGRTVAKYWKKNNHWWFRRPYDFVIGPKLKKKTTFHNS